MNIFNQSSLLIVLVLASLITTSGSSTPACCPATWISWGDHCYKFEIENKATWTEAENRCLAMAMCGRPSHLASVHSQEEQNFLHEVFNLAAPPESEWRPTLYLGLLMGNSPTSMTWTDGSCVTYTNWIGIEPNNYPGSAGLISNGIEKNGGWADEPDPNSYAENYVCKMPKNKNC